MRQPLLKSRPRRWKRGPEASLQYAICEHLRLSRLPGVTYLKIDNEGKKSPQAGAEAKRLGLYPGAADLLVLVNGQACFLELKAEGKTPTVDQLCFGLDVVDCGGEWRWAENIDVALSILRAWGALKAAGRAA